MAPKKKGKTSKKPMRRKAKATKAETVEVRKAAAMGDNSQLALPAPDDYAHHMKTIKGLKDRAATAQSLVRHAKTAANKACPGLAASIEETLSIEREGDPVKLQTRLEMMGMGLKHIGSTIQLSVFDSLAGDHMDQVYRRYFTDGQGGKALDNRYPEGSDLAAQASRAWRHGFAANMDQTPEQADAALDDDERPELQHKLPPPPKMTHQNGVSAH